MGPESYIGSIGEFAGSYAPKGWADCDGRIMDVQHNAALFSLLGITYGGDGVHNFALPDQRPWASDGQPDTGHHHRIDWREIGAPRKCICIEGIYPSRD